jgi:hypothetical protein
VVSISGSGTFDGSQLECRFGSVAVSGSGEAVVFVTEALEVDISGSGEVEYIGDPELSQSISGSGGVTRRRG